MNVLPPDFPRWLSAALFAAGLGAAFWRMPVVDAPAFVPPPAAVASQLPAAQHAQMLPGAGAIAQPPSLVQLADGRIAAAWTAGSDDDATDLAIHFSTLGSDGWSAARPIVTRESTAGGLFAHIRRVGQPVLHGEGSWLHLWYVATGIGGNAMLAHSVSTDGGRSWSRPERLPTSPLSGFGTGLRAPPLALADGGLGLPLSHDLFAGHGEWLRLTTNGRLVDKVRLAHDRRTLQPAVVALDEQRALALLRDGGPRPGEVRAVTTVDGGQQWAMTDNPGPPNGDLPLAALRLADGRLLLAGNAQQGRESLMLWLSSDAGKSWQASRHIESAADGGAAFTAPALLLGRDGHIHLAYVWRNQGIRHVRFTPAWLNGERP